MLGLNKQAEYGLSHDLATSAWRSGKKGRLRCGVGDLECRKHSSSLILVHSSCFSSGQIIYFTYRFGKLLLKYTMAYCDKWRTYHQKVVGWICHVMQSQITRHSEYSLLLIIIAEQLQIKCLPQVERNGLRPSPDPLLGLNFEFWILRKRSPTSPLWTHDIDSDYTHWSFLEQALLFLTEQ